MPRRKFDARFLRSDLTNQFPNYNTQLRPLSYSQLNSVPARFKSLSFYIQGKVYPFKNDSFFLYLNILPAFLCFLNFFHLGTSAGELGKENPTARLTLFDRIPQPK